MLCQMLLRGCQNFIKESWYYTIILTSLGIRDSLCQTFTRKS